MKHGTQGAKVVRKMGKTNAGARNRILTAVKPRAWGFTAQGCAPTTAGMLRGTIGKGPGIKKVGGCYATAFLIHGYAHRDQVLTVALENVLHFFEAWAASPSHLSRGIQVVWDEMVEKLDVPYRWGKVTGPLSSTIATLLDWHFYPVSPFL